MHYPPYVRVVQPNAERRRSYDGWLSRVGNPLGKDSSLLLLSPRLGCIRRTVEKISKLIDFFPATAVDNNLVLRMVEELPLRPIFLY